MMAGGEMYAPACVTATVRLIPPPVTVIVPLLEAVPALAVAEMVKLPLFDPLAGDAVNQEVALLLTVHDTFEVTVMLVLDAVAIGFQAEVDRASATDAPA